MEVEGDQCENGGLLAYTRNGIGRPVVFLHGLGASQAQAQSTIGDVTGIELITIDAPGHGDSADSTVALDFGSFARAVIEVLDHLKIESATFGGISMGAGISLRIAKDFPERVDALVLVRPAWIDKPGRPNLDIVADLGHWIESFGIEAARERLLDDDRFRRMDAAAPLSAASVANAIDGVATTGRPDVLRTLVDSRPLTSINDLRKIAQPSVVIYNDVDPLHPPLIAKEIANGLANAALLLAPPRYIDPEAHQHFITVAVNSFLVDGDG